MTDLVRAFSVADDHAKGVLDASVQLVEYGDFECPLCARARHIVDDLLARSDGRLLVVYRHFPMRTLHPHAERAAECAEFAASDGRFWEMHDMLYRHQQALGDDMLVEYAAALGLSRSGAIAALGSGVYGHRVERDYQYGLRSGVRRTPTFFINGIRYDGAQTFDAMRRALASAGAEKARI